MNTLVVNLYGGPGSGKSTIMAGIFSELKWMGINCEMGPEYAKEKVWEESLKILNNQIYVFGKQLHTLIRVVDKVDVVITDSPLLLSLVYGDNECEHFKKLVLDVYDRFNNLDIFLTRVKKYNPSGRLQTKEEAIEIDVKLKSLLVKNDINYTEFCGCKESVKDICDIIVRKIDSYKNITVGEH
jgi:nicotinamide riboside kinase